MNARQKKPVGVNFIIPLVVYPFDIMISIAQDDAGFRQSLISKLPPTIIPDLEDDPQIMSLSATCNGRTLHLIHGGQTIVRLKDYPHGPRGHAIVAHEIFHACTFVMNKIGVPFEVMKTDEPYAYLIDYVTQQFYENLRRA